MAADEEIFNLLTNLPTAREREHFATLLSRSAFRLERIVSHGHHSAPDFWYDQEENEWILLLSGAARLQFADREPEVHLRPGDSLLIPAHRRHRVAWTPPETATVWLALFYE